MLTEAFEMHPHVVQMPEFPGLTYVVGPGVPQYIVQPTPLDLPRSEMATDNWPFFYLKGRSFPKEYLIAVMVMFILSGVCVFGCSAGKIRSVNLHFFFLGSAFLLIETLSITRFALLFGSTWMINSIVFSSILLVVLVANLLMIRVENVNLNVLYVCLASSVVVNYFFPVDVLLPTPLPIRLTVAMVLMGAPIFCAALIFARTFKETRTPELAFASNLLGAVVGGLAEYCSLILGFRDLWILGLIMYGLSYLAVTQRKMLPAGIPATA